MEVTLGGNRLGSGNKQKVELRNYERSTFDLGYVWRSTMASGTLVPFMVELALPGDTFDIDLHAEILTHPTIGPLFGSYKVQLDVFLIPIRLYQAKLHMNMLNIGRDMSKVLLPQVAIQSPNVDVTQDIDNQQINPSSIWSYLGIRGCGEREAPATEAYREFNAVPHLGYWEIYKNYYANKMEGIGAVIHKDVSAGLVTVIACELYNALPAMSPPITATPPLVYTPTTLIEESTLEIGITGAVQDINPRDIKIGVQINGIAGVIKGNQLFKEWTTHLESGIVTGRHPQELGLILVFGIAYVTIVQEPNSENYIDQEPQVVTFPLTNIDDMRLKILQYTGADAYLYSKNEIAPYGTALQEATVDGIKRYAHLYGQEGLALKTYQSDLFNNWINTDWIDGPDGISEITRVGVGTEGFTIDELNLSKKIYDMLNRIALSGGTYDDWIDVVYTNTRQLRAESPMYLGGLMKEIIFQEVISNSETNDQPLGTLAGRGKMGRKHKGGKIIAKIDEPSYIMGLVSITPHIDYSQGNAWHTNLKTMNDFHKPQLDQIGFQILNTDQMAWFDTKIAIDDTITFRSAGKQPAWMNYMTNVNKVYGNFAEQTQQMFMVLNRRYESKGVTGDVGIKDLTTYIDPSKFNHIFADTRRDAQNFWTQIGVDISARRKMSSKVIPNL